MAIYRYDGSFEGFLCAVTDCLEGGDAYPEFIPHGADHTSGLFAGDIREVATVRETALAFRKRFVENVSQVAFATARYAFHSQKAGIELMVWRYLVLGLQVGRRLCLMLAEEPVHSVNRIARHVGKAWLTTCFARDVGDGPHSDAAQPARSVGSERVEIGFLQSAL